MFDNITIEKIINLLIECDNNTKVYFGCDSTRKKTDSGFVARYATVCIVHMNGRNGCKIFSNVSYEKDFDIKANRPKMRMLTEVQKVCELYNQLIPFIDGFDIEIHLDISTDPKNGSNCAASEAAGYVLGMTGVEPKLKPESWAASFGADGIANGRGGH